MQNNKQLKILEVADRCGWAIDRLSKPLSEIYDNVDISYFSVNPNRYLDSGYSDWEGATQFTEELAEKYDVIHFHRLEAADCFDLDRMKAKKVLTIHTERHEDWEDGRLLKFDVIVAPTKHAEQHCRDRFPDAKNTIVHVPHGVDLKKYRPLGIPPEDKNVGYVGRIVKWKRWGDAQKAVHHAGLKLVGCGYVEDSGLQNPHNLTEGKDYEYTSFLPEPMMEVFYNKMNLFLCLSVLHVEAGPLPVMEAMACGVPVISTKVGWVWDYCEHGKNVIFVSDEDVEDYKMLAGIIKSTYDAKEFREEIRQNALELIKDFSIEKYAERLMNVYENA